mmetsp:Transcript_30046/g.33565  ORF Transcript_30046/g.33565 Transcript_30046/m.33565 type:complete len:327 (+) Transcript_30046:23-1003(+)
MEGILWKQGDKFNTRWKKRLVKLIKYELVYFKDGVKKPMGRISLLKATSVSTCAKTEKQRFGFQIITKERTWHLCSATADERECWINTIQSVLDTIDKRVENGEMLSVSSRLSNSVDSQTYDYADSSPGSSIVIDRSDLVSYDSNTSRDTSFLMSSSIPESVENVQSSSATSLGSHFSVQSEASTENIEEPDTIEDLLEKLGGDMAMFELEEEMAEEKPKFLLAQNGDTHQLRDSSEFISSHGGFSTLEPRLATSLPVDIPKHLLAGKPSLPDKSVQQFAKEPTGNAAFVKPHVLAAQTYQEHYMQRFGRCFDVPLSQTRKVKAVM